MFPALILFPFCFAAAVGLGSAVLLILRCPRRWIDWSVAYLLGTGTIGTVVFLLLLARIYRRWEGVLLLAIGLLLFAFMSRPLGRHPNTGAENESTGNSGRKISRWNRALQPFPKAWDFPWKQWMTTLPAAAVYVLLFIGSLTPAFGGDELWYHLMLPKLYLQEGGMFPIPYNVPSHYPLLAEMLYVWGLSFGTVPLCKLLQWAALVCAGRLAARWAAEDGSDRAGGIAILVLVTARAAAYNRAPCQAGSDEWLLAYLCVAFFLLSRPSPHLLLSGVFLGFSLSTKLTAIPYGLIPAAAVLLVQRKTFSLKKALVFLGAAFIATLPWWIRTAIWTGDPIFPIGAAVFPTDPESLRYAEPLVRGQLGEEPYVWSAESPANWMMKTIDSKATQCAHEGNFLFLVTLWLPIVAMFSGKPGLRILGLFGTVTGVLFLVSHISHTERFFAVTQFAPAVLGGVYLDRVFRAISRAIQKIAVAALAVVCFGTYWHHQSKWSRYPHVNWHWTPPWNTAATERFLRTRETIEPTQAAYAWIDVNLPRDARILILGCWGEFYCPRPVFPTGERLRMYLRDLLEKGDEALLDQLSEQGVTHVLTGHTTPFEPGFTDFRGKYLADPWHGPGGITLWSLRIKASEKNPTAQEEPG